MQDAMLPLQWKEGMLQMLLLSDSNSADNLPSPLQSRRRQLTLSLCRYLERSRNQEEGSVDICLGIPILLIAGLLCC